MLSQPTSAFILNPTTSVQFPPRGAAHNLEKRCGHIYGQIKLLTASVVFVVGGMVSYSSILSTETSGIAIGAVVLGIALLLKSVPLLQAPMDEGSIVAMPLDMMSTITLLLSRKDTIALSSVNKTLFKRRYTFPELQHGSLTPLQIQNLYHHIHALKKKVNTATKPAQAIRCPEDFHSIQALRLTIYPHFDIELIQKLKEILPKVKHLNLNIVTPEITNEVLETLLSAITMAYPELTSLGLIGSSYLISDPPITDLPDVISQFSALETLTLSYLGRVTTLPDTIKQLSNLKTLTLESLGSLSTLPESIGRLSNLETLSLQYSNNITTLPNSVGQLSNLKTLELACLYRFTTRPESIQQLEGLQKIILWSLPQLTHFSEEVKAFIQSKSDAMLPNSDLQ